MRQLKESTFWRQVAERVERTGTSGYGAGGICGAALVYDYKHNNSDTARDRAELFHPADCTAAYWWGRPAQGQGDPGRVMACLLLAAMALSDEREARSAAR